MLQLFSVFKKFAKGVDMDAGTLGRRILNYLIKTMNGMALGLFSTLIIGVIIEQIGILTNITLLLDLAGILKGLMGVGIGVGIAWSLGLKGLALIGGAAAGGVSSEVLVTVLEMPSGDPVVAYVTTVGAIEAVKFILRKRTPFDIILIPFVSGIVAFVIAYLIGGPVSTFMSAIGDFIEHATEYQPFIMGVVIATIMGMALTSPISSAAIAVSIELGGIAGGAAVAGGAAQMIGFAVMARKDNNVGGVISVALGTSMLQFKNILRKPLIWIPPIIASAIIGPISTLAFTLRSTPIGSGMGTSAFVGQIGIFDEMGYAPTVFIGIGLIHFILPFALVLAIDFYFRKRRLFKEGDFTL